MMGAKKCILNLFISFSYAAWIHYIAKYWSFDYDALLSSIIYYRENGFTNFFEILFNNTVLLILWDYLFQHYTPNVSLDFLYGFAAFFRIFIFLTKFNSNFTLPIFLATSISFDYNQCRYSLAVSLIIILLPYINKYFLSLLIFPLHTLSPGWIFLITSFKQKGFLLLLILLLFTFAPDYFTRHFSETDDNFPRIAYVYLVFDIILFFVFYETMKLYIFNYSMVVFGIAFVYLQGNVLNVAYFFRLTDLAWQTILFHVLVSRKNGIKINNLQIIFLSSILFLATLYSYALIGGNIWRFF